MSYEDTIAEDLERAKDIIDHGKMSAEDIQRLNVEWITLETRARIIEQAGTIYGADIYPAYQLLKSFVTEIEALRASLKKIAEDDGTWSDGDGLRDGDPAFDRVQSIAKNALKDGAR